MNDSSFSLLSAAAFGSTRVSTTMTGTFGAVRLRDRRRDLARPARRDDQRPNPGLQEVLDDLHLLLDVDLALRRLHDELDARRPGRILRAALHVEEERVIERLHDERHARAPPPVVVEPPRLQPAASTSTASATTVRCATLRIRIVPYPTRLVLGHPAASPPIAGPDRLSASLASASTPCPPAPRRL